jgi:hypothetical protein
MMFYSLQYHMKNMTNWQCIIIQHYFYILLFAALSVRRVPALQGIFENNKSKPTILKRKRGGV